MLLPVHFLDLLLSFYWFLTSLPRPFRNPGALFDGQDQLGHCQTTSTPFVPTRSGSPTSSPTPVKSPTFFVITPSPINSPTSALTPTPALPIAVQALIQGTVTPAYDVQIGKIHFSTEINGYQLVAPATSFQNPIKRVFAEFTFQPIGVKVAWTALWFQNGQLKAIDTTSWENPPVGVSGLGNLRLGTTRAGLVCG